LMMVSTVFVSAEGCAVDRGLVLPSSDGLVPRTLPG